MLGTRLPRSEGRAKEVARHRPHHGHAVRYVQHGGAAREGGGGGQEVHQPRGAGRPADERQHRPVVYP